MAINSKGKLEITDLDFDTVKSNFKTFLSPHVPTPTKDEARVSAHNYLGRSGKERRAPTRGEARLSFEPEESIHTKGPRDTGKFRKRRVYQACLRDV